MSVVADGIQMNVHSVSFSYGTTPTVVAIPETEDLAISRGGDEVMYSGDDAPGPTHKSVVNRTRSIKLSGAARNVIATIPQGVKGTLTWVEDDFANGSSTGAFNGTLANCSLSNDDTNGKHNSVRMNEAMFSAIWTKVSNVWTDPLSYTIAS